MKIKILVRLLESIFGIPQHGEEQRADLFMPIWLLIFGLLLIGGSVVSLVALFIMMELAFLYVGTICLILGVLAVLCWRNQTITLIDEESFEYSTFLGNKKVYRFSDITGFRQNHDSLTLFMNNGKVHIESSAYISESLANKLDTAINTIIESNDL